MQAETSVVYLDFSYAFDSVNHQGLLHKLKIICIGGHVFNIFEDFYTNHNGQILVNGNFNQFKSVISDVSQKGTLSYVDIG